MTMGPVTGAQIAELVASHHITRWRLRSCGICNAPLYYYFTPAGAVFDSACDCTTARYRSEPEMHPYDDLAAHVFNIQTPEIRASMWSELSSWGKPTEGTESNQQRKASS